MDLKKRVQQIAHTKIGNVSQRLDAPRFAGRDVLLVAIETLRDPAEIRQFYKEYNQRNASSFMDTQDRVETALRYYGKPLRDLWKKTLGF